ncbi:hypothetical protein NPIL_177191 [Nephila pilipes]|uniref:Uncharacterized protein n=1 Tax=Nephila pilipes TaxID=299642 RepID=A0A8X6T284_NEPPI|nr:hypothetical protein NPIL_177191 [Nephila pilipes]
MSYNDFESMHSAPSSSGGESENEIGVKETTPLPASVHQSGSEDKEGFTVVSRKQRVPPIFIDESLNTPKLMKELSETANRTIHYLSIEILHLKLTSSTKLRLTSRSHTPPLLFKTTHPPLNAQTQNNPPYCFVIDSSLLPTSPPYSTNPNAAENHVFKFN